MTASTRLKAPRSLRTLLSTLAMALFIGALPGCDQLPEVIGFGHFEGINSNPEDNFQKGDPPKIIVDSGVIPLDAPFASGEAPWVGLPDGSVPPEEPKFGEEKIEEAFPGVSGELTTVVLASEFAENPLVVDVEVIEQQVVLGGDILLGHIDEFQAPRGSRSAGMARTIRRWPDGIVPFDDGDMSATMRSRIATAVSDWNRDTGLTLIRRTSETDFIRFVPVLKGCSSSGIGMWGLVQFINLASACSTGNIRHEIGHAIGLFHEHTRDDRNDFVSVTLSATNSPHNYWRYSSLGFVGVDLGPYDLNSLMHYGSFDFAIDPTVPVMLTTGGAIIVKQRAALTPGDIWGVNRMYFDTWQVSFSGTSIWNTLNFSGLDPSQLLFGDFNGDGQDDVFFANGSEWKVSWSGTSAWDTINTSGYTNLQVGDMDGDGRDDIFLATGNAWYVSWGGTSSWSLINNSSYTDVLLGDLSGDGVDDVFMADGAHFWLSYRGTSSWSQINTSGYTAVQLGDLNGDGRQDVFVPTGSQWLVSWGGTSAWDSINSSGYENLRLADFDGDGIDDVFLANGSQWSVSWNGTSGWDQINSSGYTNLGIADFDGDGEADVMAQFGPYGL